MKWRLCRKTTHFFDTYLQEAMQNKNKTKGLIWPSYYLSIFKVVSLYMLLFCDLQTRLKLHPVVFLSQKLHLEMLSDQLHTETYRQVIISNSATLRGKVVMDLGCCTSIISLFCGRLAQPAAVNTENTHTHSRIEQHSYFFCL